METNMITPSDGFNRVHTYFLTSPYNQSGGKILCTRFRNLDSEGHVCLIDIAGGGEKVLGATKFFDYNHGALAFFCANWRKVVYQEREEKVICKSVTGTSKKRFGGRICGYSGSIKKKFIEFDSTYALPAQGRMGIYTRNVDGTGKKCLATVNTLLAAHPHGASIRESGVLLRVGGQISPDQSMVLLYIVTRSGLLVRDYFTCLLDGSRLEFHGRLGGHVMWHPNSRDIFAFVKPHTSMLPDFRSLKERRSGKRYGLLARYNTKTMKMEIVSDYKIWGRCHVSPSPNGRMVVLDGIRDNEGMVSIMLYDAETGKMRVLCTQKNTRNLKNRGSKDQVVDAHPVFSHDSRKIIFNSCENDVVHLCEIAL